MSTPTEEQQSTSAGFNPYLLDPMAMYPPYLPAFSQLNQPNFMLDANFNLNSMPLIPELSPETLLPQYHASDMSPLPLASSSNLDHSYSSPALTEVDEETEEAKTPEVIKLKPGRKRKGEVVDREALRKDRMIRNRLAAQRSRERKRKEALTVEQANEKLKQRNQELEGRVQTLEQSNLDLARKLELMDSQLFQLQTHINEQRKQEVAFAEFLNAYGETAAEAVEIDDAKATLPATDAPLSAATIQGGADYALFANGFHLQI